MNFPKHNGLTLKHNEHKGYYETVIDWIKEHDETDFVSEEQKQKAIETDSVWQLQIYPRNAISFYLIYAADLDVLLDFVNNPENLD